MIRSHHSNCVVLLRVHVYTLSIFIMQSHIIVLVYTVSIVKGGKYSADKWWGRGEGGRGLVFKGEPSRGICRHAPPGEFGILGYQVVFLQPSDIGFEHYAYKAYRKVQSI